MATIHVNEFLRPGAIFKIKTFPHCTPYMYMLIYIKGSIFLQTAVYLYINNKLREKIGNLSFGSVQNMGTKQLCIFENKPRSSGFGERFSHGDPETCSVFLICVCLVKYCVILVPIHCFGMDTKS